MLKQIYGGKELDQEEKERYSRYRKQDGIFEELKSFQCGWNFEKWVEQVRNSAVWGWIGGEGLEGQLRRVNFILRRLEGMVYASKVWSAMVQVPC